MLHSLKGPYSSPHCRYHAMWELVVGENLSLISCIDDSGSSVSQEDANNFLCEAKVAVVLAASVVAGGDEDEDMFGDMA